MKILICGTHFTPAQAVIEKLRTRDWVKMVYLGRAYTREGDKTPSVESQILPGLGVKFIPIIAGRLQRFISFYTLISLLKVPVGFVQAFYYVAKERPNVVLSFGGYLSVPVVISAWLLNIPVIIHEQTLVTALANKISSFFANKIAVSYQQKYNFPAEKVVLTGNPMRQDLMDDQINSSNEIKELFATADKAKLPIVYISGGNQGSHVINEAVNQVLPELLKKAVVIHSTGDSKFQDYERLIARKTELDHPERYLVYKWVSADLKAILNRADLAVGRSGANTLMELALFGLPALLIPIPYLNQNEQMVNAKYYQKLGLATILTQAQLSGNSLLKEIVELLSRRSEIKESALAARSVVIPTAADRIVMETLLLVTPEAAHNQLDPYLAYENS